MKKIEIDHGKVLVYFKNKQSNLCREFDCTYKTFVDANKDVYCHQTDLIESARLADEYHMIVSPAFLLFKNGKIVSNLVGLPSAECLMSLFNRE